MEKYGIVFFFDNLLCKWYHINKQMFVKYLCGKAQWKIGENQSVV